MQIKSKSGTPNQRTACYWLEGLEVLFLISMQNKRDGPLLKRNRVQSNQSILYRLIIEDRLYLHSI